jgi:hypothetical protein
LRQLREDTRLTQAQVAALLSTRRSGALGGLLPLADLSEAEEEDYQRLLAGLEGLWEAAHGSGEQDTVTAAICRAPDPARRNGVERSHANEQRFEPEWALDHPHELVEDVGLLARMCNPYNSSRTLTLCNGIHSRGVLGAVRALTDARVRDANESYLAERFGADEYAILMRVPVSQGEALSPDLRNPDSRLYEWPPEAAGRGSR